MNDKYSEFRSKFKELKPRFKWLPVAFHVSVFGNWLSPKGIMYNNVQSNYDLDTLKRGYLKFPLEFKETMSHTDYAFKQGWIKFLYMQSMGGFDIDVSKDQIRRRLYLELIPNTSLKHQRQMLRVMHVIRLYYELFDSKIEYILKIKKFDNNDKKVKDVRTIRHFHPRTVDLSLQLLKNKE